MYAIQGSEEVVLNIFDDYADFETSIEPRIGSNIFETLRGSPSSLKSLPFDPAPRFVKGVFLFAGGADRKRREKTNRRDRREKENEKENYSEHGNKVSRGTNRAPGSKV